MKTSIYLADLRHNYSGVLANDCMPLGIAYLKAVMDHDVPEVASRLFAYPSHLYEAMTAAPPEVLMLSNYVWNEELSLQFARLAKRRRPDVLTVMGGPNICLEDNRRIEWLRQHPEIDVYILGEADLLAAEVVRQYLDAGRSVDAFRDRVLPSSVYRNAAGEVVLNRMWDRQKAIDEIPSVWLTGILDEFFDGKLAPMIETNRGCPFTCSFCVQGTTWYTKVHNFSVDRIKEEIKYIARRIKAVSPAMGMLRIADSNYGMFERDIEISGFIGDAQREFGWPTFIDATTGKNRPERIIQSLEKVSGALVLYQAVQSLDDAVLKNVKRSTIKLEAYEQIQIHVRGRGLRSNSDLILGLPGESLQSHLDAVHKLIDAGTSEMHNFQSMLLKGSEMEALESRELFKFDSRFRVLPKNFGEYGGDKVFDLDEIVVATEAMPFEDYLAARQYHLICSIFWNNDWFKDAIAVVQTFGIKGSEWVAAIHAAMRNDQGIAGALMTEFVGETRNELFHTREECIAFYSEPANFERLRQGHVGDNLMYKYRAVASFQLWPAICGLAMKATKELLVSRGVDGEFAEFLDDFALYTRLRHACGSSVETLLSVEREQFRYDVGRWIAAAMPRDVSTFRLSAPTTFEFKLPADSARDLAAAVEVWTTDLKGLSKLVTRIRPMWQDRQALSLTSGETGRRVAL